MEVVIFKMAPTYRRGIKYLLFSVCFIMLLLISSIAVINGCGKGINDDDDLTITTTSTSTTSTSTTSTSTISTSTTSTSTTSTSTTTTSTTIPSQWRELTSGTAQRLNDVYFINSLEGWAVGVGGVILHTINGGNTWTDQNIAGQTRNDVEAVYFSDSNNGIIVTQGLDGGLIFKTTNGGTAWTQYPTTYLDIHDLHFISAAKGWTCGHRKQILNTADSGTTWLIQKAADRDGEELLEGIMFADENTGWAVGTSGNIWRCTGGINWDQQTSNVAVTLNSVFARSSTIAYAVGASSTLLITIDGGDTWILQDLSLAPANTLMDIFFVGQYGWIMGSSGLILYSSDSGVSFSSQTSPTAADLRGCYFINQSLGWAVGTSGAILKWSP